MVWVADDTGKLPSQEEVKKEKSDEKFYAHEAEDVMALQNAGGKEKKSSIKFLISCASYLRNLGSTCVAAEGA